MASSLCSTVEMLSSLGAVVGARGRTRKLRQSYNNATENCAVQVVYPGAYRCVCVQIKLHHMAVNATAQAGVIGELEGAALLDSSLDPQGAGPAFKVLKQLVGNWLHDAVQNHNRCVKQESGCDRFNGLNGGR